MKERLVELIHTFCEKENVLLFNKEILNKFADYLFADGWIRLPCKVGNVLHEALPKCGFIRSLNVVGFHLGKFPDLRGKKRKEYIICYSDYSLTHIDIDKFGKTVFLTPEEAQAKLKEGGEG